MFFDNQISEKASIAMKKKAYRNLLKRLDNCKDLKTYFADEVCARIMQDLLEEKEEYATKDEKYVIDFDRLISTLAQFDMRRK